MAGILFLSTTDVIGATKICFRFRTYFDRRRKIFCATLNWQNNRSPSGHFECAVKGKTAWCDDVF